MTTFKKGDKVVCVNKAYNFINLQQEGGVEIGKVYPVIGYYKTETIGIGSNYVYPVSMFKLHEEVDTGEDLIGLIVTRGGSTHYTISRGCNPATIKLTWGGGTENKNVKQVRKFIKEGTWKIAKTVSMQNTAPVKPTALEIGRRMHLAYVNAGWSNTDLLKLDDATVQTYLDNYNLHKGYKGYQIRQIIHNIIDGVYDRPKVGDTVTVKKHLPIFDTTETRGQHYDAQTETYSTQPEEEINMTKSTRTIEVKVSTKPFAKTEVVTLSGSDVSTMTEQDLYNELTYLQNEEDKLKALKTGTSSKRISAQIKALKDARGELIAIIDALPEDE